MIRGSVCLFLSSLVCLACADYGSHQDPECEGVVCNSPPAATCADNLTVRTYKSPGTCKAGVCSYDFEDIECAEGECIDGVCAGCNPNCDGRECGPDPRCGYSCGECTGCYGEPDPSLCMDDGTCAMVCCPDCSGRECGDDGCGGICGTCDPGCSCNTGGRCECGCADILVDNQGPLGLYPLMYTEPQDASERYRQDLAAFLDACNVSLSDYLVEPHPVTWAPDLDKQYSSGAWITVYDIELSENNIEDAARGLLSSHAEFFKTAGALIQARNSNCSGSTCRVNFDQSYCGLQVVSPETEYTGTLTLVARQQDAGLQRAVSNLVPMIPVYTNPHISPEEAAASLAGMTLEYWCADGPHYATVTDQSVFAFSADPAVFVQTAPTGIIALEYRLAHKVTITVESFLSWTAYVDAFDGSLLKIDPDFICD
jgi:hypothetical protein